MASYRADGMLGNDLRQVPGCDAVRCVYFFNLFRNVSVSNLKEASLQAKMLSVNYY